MRFKKIAAATILSGGMLLGMSSGASALSVVIGGPTVSSNDVTVSSNDVTVSSNDVTVSSNDCNVNVGSTCTED